MINENILSYFKSDENRPFSIIITDIKSKEDCNKDNIIFTVHQINKKRSEIEDENPIERKLTISSDLYADEKDGLYKTKLIGFMYDEKVIKSDEKTTDIQFQEPQTVGTETGLETEGNINPNILKNCIEVLETKLKKEIEIEFNREYTKIPKIIINVDKKNQSLYRSWSYEFITNEVENKIQSYQGVKITFNSLKTKMTYPTINIIIIGEYELETESEGATNNEG